MSCPKCNVSFSKISRVDSINKADRLRGKQELSFTVHYIINVKWVGEHFHCNVCGCDFSYKEYVMQKTTALKRQTRLTEVTGSC